MLRRLPSRRELLTRTSCGFGAVALHALLADAAVVQDEKFGLRDTVSEQRPMFAPRVKRIIFVFMQGGPSHVDSFDYKPKLISRDGQSVDFTGVRFGDFGKETQQKLMKPTPSNRKMNGVYLILLTACQLNLLETSYFQQ